LDSFAGGRGAGRCRGVVKKSGGISTQAALAHLKKGVLVVDVRSRGEFDSGHLPGALNIPLDEIEAALPAKVKNKNQVLLLHCLSGARSAAAQQKLKGMGYANVLNLGSLARARPIAGSQNSHSS
jgi:phage shock protein E